MSKKLNLTAIKDSNKKYKEKKRIELSDGSHLFIYPHFSKPDMLELFRNVFEEYNNLENKKLMKNISMGLWTSFSMVAKFTDLGIPQTGIKNRILAFNELLTYDLYDEILSSFPEESINRFNEVGESYYSALDELLTGTTDNLQQSLVDKMEELEREAKNEEINE